MKSLCNLITIRVWKFEEDCFKTLERDRLLMKLSFFAFLVCAFNKEPIELSGFDLLYIKNYFEFLRAVKKQLVCKYKIYKSSTS